MIKLFFIALLSFSSLNVYSGNPEKVSNALQNANPSELSEMFNSSIELTMPNVSGVYTKEQAKLVLDNFLKANVPSKCTLTHESSGSTSVMLVYELVTKNGQFRVSIVANVSGGGFIINELKIQ
ncbi:MAG: DUF4783 domain-containing protein [Bacteroidetes bacterium]|nr:DUF4783 domain-containing protein [Bacteroidota bacterium]